MPGQRARNWGGMNWIRQEKRLAIYLRDGLVCIYCGARAEDGVQLTLDHVRPYSKGGMHHATNLVTCCKECNTRRQDKALSRFCRQVGGAGAVLISQRVKRVTRRKLPMDEAKKLIARRGSAARVVASL